MAAPQIDTIDTTAVAAIQEVRTLTQLIQTLLEPSMLSSLKESVHDARELLALLVTNEGRLQALLGNIEQDTQQIGLLLDEKTVASLKQSAAEWAAAMWLPRLPQPADASARCNAELDRR